MSTLVVIAKECIPGHVKTRLHPPLTLDAAARVAAASLAATLRTALSVPADRHVLFLDGRPPAGTSGFEVLPQPTGGLDERLGALFDASDGRTLLIGMDTPQVTAAILTGVFTDDSGADAWFGPAVDGGFWALGLEHPTGDLLRGIPMSRDDTGARQLDRLQAAGLRVAHLPALTDMDTIDSAREVAALLPGSAFAATLAAAEADSAGAVSPSATAYAGAFA